MPYVYPSSLWTKIEKTKNIFLTFGIVFGGQNWADLDPGVLSELSREFVQSVRLSVSWVIQSQMEDAFKQFWETINNPVCMENPVGNMLIAILKKNRLIAIFKPSASRD